MELLAFPGCNFFSCGRQKEVRSLGFTDTVHGDRQSTQARREQGSKSLGERHHLVPGLILKQHGRGRAPGSFSAAVTIRGCLLFQGDSAQAGAVPGLCVVP